MPVSGLIVSLGPDSAAVERTLATLAEDPRFVVGEQRNSRLALVLDTPNQSADREAWRDLEALPAVRWIDLVYISIDPNVADPAGGTRHERRH